MSGYEREHLPFEDKHPDVEGLDWLCPLMLSSWSLTLNGWKGRKDQGTKTEALHEAGEDGDLDKGKVDVYMGPGNQASLMLANCRVLGPSLPC